jgi:hypothetical protein
MARGGKRPGAGRKPNPHKGKSANPAREPQAPRSYDPEVAYQARKLCQLGATDIELADFFGVCRDTIYRWIIEFLRSSNLFGRANLIKHLRQSTGRGKIPVAPPWH